MRDPVEYIERRIAQVYDAMYAMIFGIARFTKVSKSSANGQTDKVEGQPNISNEQAVGDEVRRLGGGGWGLAAVPPAGEPALVVRPGGGATNGVIVACGSERYFPANMADGDVALYCKKSGTTIYLKASDGSIAISDNGGNQVKLNGTNTITIAAASGGTISITGTGAINLGNAIDQVLIKGSVDSYGVPVTQLPAAAASVVKAG